MIELYPDHYEVVKESLSGKRIVDEQTLASVAVLGERLEHVRKMGGKFSSIGFSPAVERLKTHPTNVAIG
jgi:hypothetical protein